MFDYKWFKKIKGGKQNPPLERKLRFVKNLFQQELTKKTIRS